MTPAAIIAGARADGIFLAVTPDGGLTFKGPRVAADKWVPILKDAKPAIVAHLSRAQRSAWDASDWRAYFDERAAIVEYDGGMSRREAEAQAMAECITEWRNRHPVRSPSGVCLGCGRHGSDEAVLPFGADDRGHAWLHQVCWSEWDRGRNEEARKALAGFVLDGLGGHT